MFKVVYEKNGQEKMYNLNTNKIRTAKQYAMELCEGQPNIKLYRKNILVAYRKYHEFCGMMPWSRVAKDRHEVLSSE